MFHINILSWHHRLIEEKKKIHTKVLFNAKLINDIFSLVYYYIKFHGMGTSILHKYVLMYFQLGLDVLDYKIAQNMNSIDFPLSRCKTAIFKKKILSFIVKVLHF